MFGWDRREKDFGVGAPAVDGREDAMPTLWMRPWPLEPRRLFDDEIERTDVSFDDEDTTARVKSSAGTDEVDCCRTTCAGVKSKDCEGNGTAGLKSALGCTPALSSIMVGVNIAEDVCE